MKNNTLKNENWKSIQMLRAIASTMVVYYHISVIPVFGSFGVDIFFVLSGFVMAMIVQNGERPLTFLINRITRIVPLYWILTTGVIIIAMAKPELLSSTTANATNYLKSIFFIPYTKENGALNPVLAVGWTLNYEMYFYLLIWISIITKKNYYLTLTFIYLIISYCVTGNTNIDQTYKSFYSNSIIFEFGLGMIAYKIYNHKYIVKLNSLIITTVGISSIAIMVYLETSGKVNIRLIEFGIPSFMLLLSAITLEQKKLIKSNLIVKSIVEVGNASYATYLSHFYIVIGFEKIGFEMLNFIDPYSTIGVILIISTSLFSGHILYKYVDMPLSRYLKYRCFKIFKIDPFIQKSKFNS